jgi:hypothetical protein
MKHVGGLSYCSFDDKRLWVYICIIAMMAVVICGVATSASRRALARFRIVGCTTAHPAFEVGHGASETHQPAKEVAL